MSKFTGNIIRLPAVTPTQNSASGVYTLDDQFTAQSSGTWPIVRDQYFNYTTLLLTGAVQGTAYPNPVTQPYSFLSDASTNNFVVSPNGDVSARPFNPYLNNYSNYFNGSSGVNFANNAGFDFSTGDFTIESWVYIAGNSALDGSSRRYANIFSVSTTGAFNVNFVVRGDSTTTGTGLEIYNGTSTVAVTGSISQNAWNHVAVSRSGANAYFWLNGQQMGATQSISGSWGSSANAGQVGQSANTVGYSFPLIGYLSNVRVVKGRAVYTSAFTPSTTPLTRTSGGTNPPQGTECVLLTCQSNRFLDSNGPNVPASSPLTTTVSGSPAVSQNSPFVSYDTTNGSGYFDGTGDWLSISSSSAFGFGSSLNDFTVQGWFYIPAAITGNARGIFHVATSISSVVTGYGVGITNTQVLQYYAGGTFNNSTTTVTPGQWYYLTMVRSAGTVSVYLNGSLIQNGSIADSQNLTTAEATVGVWFEKSSSFGIPGYISDFRIVKGSALSATIPTAPLQAVTNTSLLTLQTRAPATNNGFIDSSPNNFVVTRNGNATQGSFSPFSPTGWGNYFSGSNAYLRVANNSAFYLGSGDFTMECWVNPANVSTTRIMFNKYISGSINTSNTAFIFYLYDASGTPRIGANLCSGTTETFIGWNFPGGVNVLNTWNHIALVRQGNTISVYCNGVACSIATGTSSYSSTLNDAASADLSIALRYNDNNGPFTGYISNARIVKGQALYTGSFTSPSSALTATSVGTSGTNVATSITGTVSLLTCQSNRFVDNSPNNFTVQTFNTPTVQAFSPFAPAQSYIPSQIGGSGYLDGTGDYLSVADNTALDMEASDFTMECWVYLNETPSSADGIFAKRTDISTFGGVLIFFNGLAPNFYVTLNGSSWGIAFSSSISATLNAWTHLAFTRSGSTWTIYVNGVSGGTGNSSGTVPNNASAFVVGAYSSDGNATYLFPAGYISNVRVVKGTAVYTSNFTPPTAPPTAITNTSLLLNFTNGGIVDATGKNNLETVANSGVQTSIINPFGSRTGLMYFNGSSYFYEPYTQLMNQLNGNFTIECWIYPTTSGVQQIFAGSLNSAGSTNWLFQITSANKLSFSWVNTTPTSFDATSTASISTNTWTYVAAVKNGGTITLYINGSADGTASPTGTYRNASFGFGIGRPGDYNGVYFTGYIDEFRMAYVARTITASPTGPFPLG